MTTIKQVSASSSAHVANVSKYLNDERALRRDSQHIMNDREWEKEMDATRRAYGHDGPSRPGVSSALLYHQVIAFNPDECSCNGGPMTPEKCMDFAREWVQRRHPSQEAVWVLHLELCEADGTSRYAVHLAINRTDLETGLRFNEGRAKHAKVERANAMRDMDREWGLREVRANERNSVLHARQPTRAEKEMELRGVRSDKQYLRDAVKASVREARQLPQEERAQAFKKALEGKGVRVSPSKGGKDLTFERKSTGLKVNGTKLGRGFSRSGIVRALGAGTVRAMEYILEEGMDYGR